MDSAWILGRLAAELMEEIQLIKSNEISCYAGAATEGNWLFLGVAAVQALLLVRRDWYCAASHPCLP